MRKNLPLHETITVFREAGLVPEVHHGRKHVKVRAEKPGQNRLAVVAATASDQRAGLNARAVARKLVGGTYDRGPTGCDMLELRLVSGRQHTMNCTYQVDAIQSSYRKAAAAMLPRARPLMT